MKLSKITEVVEDLRSDGVDSRKIVLAVLSLAGTVVKDTMVRFFENECVPPRLDPEFHGSLYADGWNTCRWESLYRFKAIRPDAADEIERLRADAERYRFTRARKVAKAHELGLPNYTNEMFDEYTDAAMNDQKGAK